MKPKIAAIGAAVVSMFNDKEDEQLAAQARAMRAPAIAATREILTLEMVDKLANDEMPECFEIKRELVVAMAQITMRALATVQRVADSVTPPSGPQH